MLEPKLEARVLQAIKPQSKDTILEIGTGSGYMAALLAYFGKSVTTIELLPELADFAVNNLHKCRIPNVRVEMGDGLLGWHTDKKQTFDIICISGGVTQVPEVLKEQLNIGGRLLAPFVGEAPLMQAVLITRLNHEFYQTQSLFETLVPMLHSKAIARETFEF
jgi:protein-L-isoaspartate(D-aspartate) O-methyltransferase